MYREAKSKFNKDEVGFEHPAKGDHDCDECVHYQAKTRSCEIVKGDILPEDWCKKFKEKKRGKTNH